jgi:hypothetical protein
LEGREALLTIDDMEGVDAYEALSLLGLVHVRRLKSGTASVHPMGGTEKDALVKAISDRNFPLTAYSPSIVRPTSSR